MDRAVAPCLKAQRTFGLKFILGTLRITALNFSACCFIAIGTENDMAVPRVKATPGTTVKPWFFDGIQSKSTDSIDAIVKVTRTVSRLAVSSGNG